MKTTIDLPDALLRKAKSTAALEGTSLKDLVIDAIERRLESSGEPSSGRRGWRAAFGLADRRQVDTVDRIVARDLETVDPGEWE